MGFAKHPACPACGSDYWKWTNFGSGDDDQMASDTPSNRLQTGTKR